MTNETTSDLTEEQAQAKATKLQADLAAINKIFPSTATVKKSNRIIKLGEKGGLYIVDPTFKAISKAGKPYLAGVNMNLNVAKALFGNAEILSQVTEFLTTDMKTEVNTTV